MSLEDQNDAWVRGLMGGGKYAANEQQAEDANDAVQQMQAQLEAPERGPEAPIRCQQCTGRGAESRCRHRRECAQNEQ